METLAKTFVTSQIIGIDPQLSNFKQSVIGSKAFVLDTDFVLYALVQNGRYSKQYRMLIDQLASCGCKLYIPKKLYRKFMTMQRLLSKIHIYFANNIKC